LGEKESKVQALIDITVVPHAHSTVYEFLKKNPFVEHVYVTYGRPDITACLKVENLAQLYSVINEITANHDIASTNTRIVVDNQLIEYK